MKRNFNTLMLANFKLTRPEQRFLWLLFAKVNRKTIDENTELAIGVEDLDYYDGKNFKTRELIYTLGETLLEKRVILNTKNKESFLWFSSIEVNPSATEAIFKFSKEVIPFLRTMPKDFAKKEEAQRFKSSYTFRLYTLLRVLSRNGKKSKVVVSVQDLYFMLIVPEGMQNFKTFNRDILKPALQTIERVGERGREGYKKYLDMDSRTRKWGDSLKLREFDKIKVSSTFIKHKNFVKEIEFSFVEETMTQD